MVASGAVAMEELMERVTDREGHRDHQQHRQNAADCRFRRMAGYGKCSSRLHDNTRNQAHSPIRRKLDQCRISASARVRPYDELTGIARALGVNPAPNSSPSQR